MSKRTRVQRILASHWVRYALPFVAFCVLGSVGVAHVLDTRLRARDAGRHVAASRKYDAAKAAPTEFSLDAELARMKQTIDLDRWRNKPVPEQRSWEDADDDNDPKRPRP